jgi:predicted metal-dependent enzyme (double-stranded beta helix superfamily)
MHERPDGESTTQRYPVLPAMTLKTFCRHLGTALAQVPEAEAPARAAALLPGVLANPALLAVHQRAAPETGYGRHCIFICPQDRFSVLAVVWPAGIGSPVHDHATWCAFGVYEGALEERRYRPAGGGCAVECARLVHRPGAVAHLPVDAPDIHSMHNPATRPVISIHVYGGNSDRLGPNVKTIWPVEG